MDKKIRLVVARYNEDLNWISHCESMDISSIIYDKSDINLKNIDDYVRVSDNLYKLPNIGREAQTYLKHIVENYDNLADIEIFTQGRPFDHIPDFLNKISLLRNQEFEFIDFSTYRKISCLNMESYISISKKYPHIDINDTGSGSYIFLASDGHKKLYNLVHGEISNSESEFLEFGQHAMFAVSSSRIRKIPLSIYRKMLNLFTFDILPTGNIQHIYWAYEFEYTWKYIFSDKL